MYVSFHFSIFFSAVESNKKMQSYTKTKFVMVNPGIFLLRSRIHIEICGSF